MSLGLIGECCGDCVEPDPDPSCYITGFEGFAPWASKSTPNITEGDGNMVVSVRRTPSSLVTMQRYDCSGRLVAEVCKGVEYRVFFDSDVDSLFNGVITSNVVHKFDILEVFELYNVPVDTLNFEVAARPFPAVTVAVAEGQRILLAAQADSTENGIYVVGPVTDGVAELERSDDMLGGSVAAAGLMVRVVNGANTPLVISSLHDGFSFVLQTKLGVTVGADPQVWLICGTISPRAPVSLPSCPNFATEGIVETSPGVFRYDTNGIVGGFSYSYYIDSSNEKLYEGAHYAAPVAVRESWVEVGDVNAALVSSFGDYIYIGWASNSAGGGFTLTFDQSKKFCAIIRSAVPMSGLTLEDFITLSTNSSPVFFRWSPASETEFVSDGALMTAVGNAVVIKAKTAEIPAPCGYDHIDNVPPYCGAIITYREFAQLAATVDFKIVRELCACPHIIEDEAACTPDGTIEFAVGEWKKQVLVPEIVHDGPSYWGCEGSAHDGFESAVFTLWNLVTDTVDAVISYATLGISVTCTHDDRNPDGIASVVTRAINASYSEPAGFMDFRYECDATLIAADVWTGVDTYRRKETAGEHPIRPPCVPDPLWTPCVPFDPFNAACFQPCIEQPPEAVTDEFVAEYHQHSYPRLKESSTAGNGEGHPACEDDGFYLTRTTNKEDYEWSRDDPGAEPPDDSFSAGELTLKNTAGSGVAEVEALFALGDYGGPAESTKYCAYLAGATAIDPDTREVELDSADLPLFQDNHPLANTVSGSVAACRLKHGNFSVGFEYNTGATYRRYHVCFSTMEVWENSFVSPDPSPTSGFLGVIGNIDDGVLTGADDETVQFAWASDTAGTDFTTTFDPALTHIAVFRGLAVAPTIGDLDDFGFQPYLSLFSTPAMTYTIKSLQFTANFYLSGNMNPVVDPELTVTTYDLLGDVVDVEVIPVVSGSAITIDPPDDWGQYKLIDFAYPTEFVCHPNAA